MPDGLNATPTPALPMSVTLLARWFGERLGVADVMIIRTDLLPGGAVQYIWRIDLDVNGVGHS